MYIPWVLIIHYILYVIYMMNEIHIYLPIIPGIWVSGGRLIPVLCDCVICVITCPNGQ